ncbi:MAG TPA: iron ABC transporter permease [Nitrospiria bacterium]|nr:iron ABC transporter permease [Candidatus Manganitrophaceae bacterium]HIL35640.1 iron ABC transporter permease [Candidatus Manganitrophaceae bacterium]
MRAKMLTIQKRARVFPATAFILFLTALLAGCIVLATATGAVQIPYALVTKILLNRLPLVEFSGWEKAQEIIIMTIRLPRVLLAVLVGGGLAITGATLQALFRNPMADPGVIGISSGAALAAVIALSSGMALRHYMILPFSAFLGALGTLFLVYSLATRQGRTPMATFLLSGIAIGIFMGSILSLILTRVSSIEAFREIFFWLMGGLDGRGWSHLKIASWPILIGSLTLIFFSRDLNLLMLEGEGGSAALGMEVKTVQRALLALTSLVIGTAVAFSGTVPFVGLIVPHIVRLMIGPDHRYLMFASFLAGASLLVGADLMARTVVAPEELPLGTVTSLIGVPFFLYLLNRDRGNSL